MNSKKLWISLCVCVLLVGVWQVIQSATVSRGYTFGSTEQVTNTKLHTLVDGSTVTGITGSDMANGTVGNTQLGQNSVTSNKIANASIIGANILDRTLTSSLYATNSVDGIALNTNITFRAGILDLTLPTLTFANRVFTSTLYATNSVDEIALNTNITFRTGTLNFSAATLTFANRIFTSSLYATNSVDGIALNTNLTFRTGTLNATNAILLLDVNNAVTTSAGAADSGKLAKLNASGQISSTMIPGGGTNAAIADRSITSVMYGTNSVDDVAFATNHTFNAGTWNMSSVILTLPSSSVTSGNIVDLTIANGDVANNTLTASKLVDRTLTSITYGTNTVDDVAFATNHTFNAGTWNMSSVILTLPTSSVTSANIVDATIVAGDIAARTLTSGLYATNSVDDVAFATNHTFNAGTWNMSSVILTLPTSSVTSANIVDATIVAGDITARTLTSGLYATNSVDGIALNTNITFRTGTLNATNAILLLDVNNAVLSSAGAADSGKLVKLDATGKLDSSFNSASTVAATNLAMVTDIAVDSLNNVYTNLVSIAAPYTTGKVFFMGQALFRAAGTAGTRAAYRVISIQGSTTNNLTETYVNGPAQSEGKPTSIQGMDLLSGSTRTFILQGKTPNLANGVFTSKTANNNDSGYIPTNATQLILINF